MARKWWWIAMVLLLVACQREAPEERLRKQFAVMQAAAEQGKAGDFMEGVSQDFAGDGGMDRAALYRLLQANSLGGARIGATTGPLEVKVQGDNATVDFQVLLTGGRGRLVPEQMGSYRISSAWRVEDGEWRVYYASWANEQR